jgi:hypothetical protein
MSGRNGSGRCGAPPPWSVDEREHLFARTQELIAALLDPQRPQTRTT